MARKKIKNFYDMNVYVPNANAKPIMYKGIKYKSKAQCMALEKITRKELDMYIKENPDCVNV